MNKNIIVGAVIVVAAVVTISLALKGSTTYASVVEAKENPETTYHLVGEWVKEKHYDYEPLKNPDFFSFHMKDSLGAEVQVVLNKEKPGDFERSDKIVVTGKMSGEVFQASEILMKCPSKYNANELEI
jgi:cytochrome c-type biogenesis protein CcmE